MAFPNDLKNDFKTADALDKLEPLSGYDAALHQNQQDDLSTNDPAKVADVKRFFDYMALHVLIPCINALNRAVLALKGNTSTSLEKLEKKLTDLSGGTTKSVKALEERVDTVEKASAVSTAKVEAATELAKAAAENVMQKDQCASVMDLITGQPMYFGRGSEEEVDESIPVAPGETVYFVEGVVDYETLVQHPQNTENPHGVTYEQVGAAPSGIVRELIGVSNDTELDEKLKAVYASMPNCTISHIVIVDNNGNTFFGGGNVHVTIYKTSDDYGAVETIQYSIYGRPYKCARTIFQGIWNDWGYENPGMNLGVEYRTTERWKGLPVYKKLVSYTFADEINVLDTYADVLIPTEITGSYQITHCSAVTSSGATLPYLATGGGVSTIIRVTGGNATLRVCNDIWTKGMTINIEMAYVKN